MEDHHKYMAWSYRRFSNTCLKHSPSPEPCPPLNVSSHLMCSTNTAQVSWAASANAANYTLTATGGGRTLTCDSPSNNCTLSNLVCGEAYDMLVTATDGTCVSNHSAPFRQDEGTGRRSFQEVNTQSRNTLLVHLQNRIL